MIFIVRTIDTSQTKIRQGSVSPRGTSVLSKLQGNGEYRLPFPSGNGAFCARLCNQYYVFIINESDFSLQTCQTVLGM